MCVCNAVTSSSIKDSKSNATQIEDLFRSLSSSLSPIDKTINTKISNIETSNKQHLKVLKPFVPGLTNFSFILLKSSGTIYDLQYLQITTCSREDFVSVHVSVC